MGYFGSTVDTTEGRGTVTLYEKGYDGEDSILWVLLDDSDLHLPFLRDAVVLVKA